MAGLCAAGEPGALHVPEAARRQAALFRRHSQGGRRLYRAARGLSCQRDERSGTHRESGLAYPQRQPAKRALSGQLRALAQSGERIACAQPRCAVGLHSCLCAACIARGQSGSRKARRLCAALLRGLCPAAEEIPRAEREGTHRAQRACGCTRETRRRARLRDRAECRLRSRQGAQIRAAARLVQGPVRSPVRAERGSALRLLRGALWLPRNRSAHPPRTRGRTHHSCMKTVFALLLGLGVSPAFAATPYDIYATGRYDEAMRAGAASAALADATTRPSPCLDCLYRAEEFARKAIAADPRLVEGHVYLAVAM